MFLSLVPWCHDWTSSSGFPAELSRATPWPNPQSHNQLLFTLISAKNTLCNIPYSLLTQSTDMEMLFCNYLFRTFTIYEAFLAGNGWQCEAALDEWLLWSNMARFMFVLHLGLSRSSKPVDMQHDTYVLGKNSTVLSCSELSRFSWNEGQNTDHF